MCGGQSQLFPSTTLAMQITLTAPWLTGDISVLLPLGIIDSRRVESGGGEGTGERRRQESHGG